MTSLYVLTATLKRDARRAHTIRKGPPSRPEVNPGHRATLVARLKTAGQRRDPTREKEPTS